MLTSRLSVTTTGTPFEWGGTVGGTPFIASNDGDTSYAARQTADGSGIKRAVWDLEDLPAHAHRIISVRAEALLRETVAEATTEGHLFLRYSGTNLDEAGTRDLGTSYELAGASFAGPPGGGAWSPAIVNATQLGLMAGSPNTPNEVRATYGYVDVEWAPQPGAFLMSIWPWVGPLIGSAVLLQELPAIARAVARRSRGRLRLLPSELGALGLAFGVRRRRSFTVLSQSDAAESL